MTRINRIIAGSTFLIALALYLKTMAPAVSFWDCGEFIATSYILGVPHPPGSPLFLLLGRIFLLLPTFDDLAARVNLISPLTSAASVMFLYLCVVMIIRKYRGRIENTSDAIIAYGSAFVAALTFMVSDSQWFNAVEAEVYGMSTLLTAFVVWLILRWSQRDEDGSHIRYILLLAYVLGLAAGLHLLNLLALPFITLVIYFRKREFSWPGFLITIAVTGAIFLIIYKGIIKGLPQLAMATSVYMVVFVVLALAMGMIWAIMNKRNIASLALTSLFLIILGYSTYAIIFIRSNQNPVIDENNPETTARAVAYMEREQYGDWSMFDRARWTPQTKHRYTGVTDYFWSYQVEKMYVRYFLWQFAGRGPSTQPGVSPFGATNMEDGVDWLQFGVPLALIIGLLGLGYHFQRDPKHALAVLALFAATGLMIILYLNQPDPQPRERDYSYVGSFFTWSIWIGIGVAAILEWISLKLAHLNSRKMALYGSVVMLTAVMPGVMLSANYHIHDRTGNYVAWDYSNNLLNSCKPNSIIFTNGDNDTFPLWYLQEVEGIRKDVRVVNLSLLNTPWYIQQLKDLEPKVSELSLSDNVIERIQPIPWEAKEYSLPAGDAEHPDRKITWNLKPTYAGRFLRVQDIMIVKLIQDINWTRPIYFAVTVAPENKLGLDRYLEMQGMVYELMPKKGRTVNIEMLHDNLVNRYKYRNLDDPAVYYNHNIQRLLQNMRASFLQLALNRIQKSDPDSALSLLDTLEARIPEHVIPVRSKELYLQMGYLHAQAGDTDDLKQRLDNVPPQFRMTVQDTLAIADLYFSQLDERQRATEILAELHAGHRRDGQVISALIQLYRQYGTDADAITVLQDWLLINPSDKNASALLKELEGS